MQKSIVSTLLLTSIVFAQISVVRATSVESELIFDTENNPQSQDIATTLENISDHDPAKFIPNTIISDQGRFTSEQKSYNISMNINPSQKNVTFTKKNVSIGISMPNQKNFSSIQNVNGRVVSREKLYDVVIESIDGGIRYILHINSPKAEKSYDFKMDLPTGYRLTQDKEGNVNILDASGKTYAGIAKPWAKDANDKDIKTWYMIKGSTLTQYVDFDKKTVFPVVADPIWCGQTIASTSWIYRTGTHPWSLSIEPTACGKWSGVYSPAGYWQDLLDKTPVSVHWDKKYGNSIYWSMYDQLFCHVDFAAGFKSPWNLEPTRPNVGYNATVSALCNPN